MKKVLLAIVILLSAPLFTLGQVRVNIDGIVGRFQQFFNNRQYDSIFVMLSARSQTLLPADKLTPAMEQLHKQAGDLEKFELMRLDEKLFYYKMTFKNTPLTLMSAVDADSKLEKFRFIPYREESDVPAEKSNFILNTPTGRIYGSLTQPEGTKKVPVALLIAGSGPTDRNCNNNMNLKTNAFKMLADSLKAAGIACVRYDKRGVGESMSALDDRSSLTLGTYVDDAVGFIKMLKSDTCFSEVIVIGHSEGSLIGMVAAQKEGVKKYVSISGAGESIDKTLIDQYLAQSKDLATAASNILDSLKKGKDVTEVPDGLFNVFNPAMQPYLRSCLKYDPQVEIRKLKMPILIVQGDNDLQVSLKNALNLKKAVPRAKLEVISNMNHALKDAPEDKALNFATYSNGNLPLSAGCSNAIIHFIKG